MQINIQINKYVKSKTIAKQFSFFQVVIAVLMLKRIWIFSEGMMD
jgi:hypothetical protein